MLPKHAGAYVHILLITRGGISMQSWQYIALLGAVIVIAALLLPKSKDKQHNASSGAQMEQLELAFEQFMENMEKEQQELVKMLTDSLQQLREEDRVKSETIARLEQRHANMEEQLAKLAQQHAALEAKLQMLQPYAEPKPRNDASSSTILQEEQMLETVEAEHFDENSIHRRYAELFDMYHAGKSIEAIAKKLGKNKGEVQLILQLAMQEEKARHA